MSVLLIAHLQTAMQMTSVESPEGLSIFWEFHFVKFDKYYVKTLV